MDRYVGCTKNDKIPHRPCLSHPLTCVPCLSTQEHVGEYGAHWNFFCTIAVVTLLAHAAPVPPERLAAAAVAVTCLHQAALSCGELI